jgi:hypothetical protein
MRPASPRNPAVGIRGLLAITALVLAAAPFAGCKSDTTASDGDPQDAAHRQAQADVSKNLQNALNDPAISADQRQRIQAQANAAVMQRQAMAGLAGATPVYARKK